MARALDLGPQLTVHIGDDGVAEVVFRPARARPATHHFDLMDAAKRADQAHN